jgi:hypothetical protein
MSDDGFVEWCGACEPCPARHSYKNLGKKCCDINKMNKKGWCAWYEEG